MEGIAPRTAAVTPAPTRKFWLSTIGRSIGLKRSVDAYGTLDAINNQITVGGKCPNAHLERNLNLAEDGFDD
jgi:hypothetical protein